MQLSLERVAHAVGAVRVDGYCAGAITGVVTDNRQVRPGNLFVCIPGERVDGHDFARAAACSGAAAVLAQHPVEALPEGTAVILVENSVRALGRLAAFWRQGAAARVVGLTGTAGKTTVKELLRQVLSVRGVTAYTSGNHNNQIGLPMSLLHAPQEAAFWVMEAGISRPQDMDELGSVLRPDLGLVLNVGPGHTAGLGEKGVAWHKARLLHWCAPKATGLVSADYPDLVREARAVFPAVQFFSVREDCAEEGLVCRGKYLGCTPAGRGCYRVVLEGRELDLETALAGDYATENVVAVVAAAHRLGLSSDEIRRGMAAALLPEQRFQRHCLGAWECIDDSYNANPLSMHRMIRTAAELAGEKALVLVLGEMKELGEVAEGEHRRLGRLVAACAPRLLFWRGGQEEALRRGLAEGGYGGRVLPARDVEAFLEGLKADAPAGGVILFKGSRSNHLEECFQAFMEWESRHAV